MCSAAQVGQLSAGWRRQHDRQPAFCRRAALVAAVGRLWLCCCRKAQCVCAQTRGSLAVAFALLRTVCRVLLPATLPASSLVLLCVLLKPSEFAFGPPTTCRAQARQMRGTVLCVNN